MPNQTKIAKSKERASADNAAFLKESSGKKSKSQPQKAAAVIERKPEQRKFSAREAVKQKKHRAMFRKLLTFDGNHRLHPETKKQMVHLIGTDEVGRGCLAGPVVAAAAILPEIKMGSQIAKSLIELNDSKKLSFQQRERLSIILQDICVWAIGEASPAEINEINILNASLLAMKRAIESLQTKVVLELHPILVIIDGNKKIKDVAFEQKTVVDGDAKSASIAAASIIAKVHRDRFMMQLSETYPAFNWYQNKGYGSKVHRMALREFGMTEWHRRLFCEKILVEQLTLDLSSSSAPNLDCDDIDASDQFDKMDEIDEIFEAMNQPVD